MSKRQKKQFVGIRCERGQAIVFGEQIDCYYRPKFWFFKINPRLLLPSLASDQKKKIIVNGRRSGIASYHYGMAPVPENLLPDDVPNAKLKNFFRKLIGYTKLEYAKGYARIKLKGLTLIVTIKTGNTGLARCTVYDKKSGMDLGALYFPRNTDYFKVFIRYPQFYETLLIAAGYVYEVLVFRWAVPELTRDVAMERMT